MVRAFHHVGGPGGPGGGGGLIFQGAVGYSCLKRGSRGFPIWARSKRCYIWGRCPEKRHFWGVLMPPRVLVIFLAAVTMGALHGGLSFNLT